MATRRGKRGNGEGSIYQDADGRWRSVVDLGYRGVDADNPGIEIIHRGRYKSLSKQQRRWLKRRQSIEPLIGHTKSDHRMERCWLKGALGDALHALSCAAGYNIRWLLRAIARLGAGVTSLRRLMAAILRWLGTSPSSTGRGNPFAAVSGLAVNGRPIRTLPQI